MMRWSEQDYADHLAKAGVPGAANAADVSEPPFWPMEDVVLDLPPPISVNALRRIDWSASVRTSEWKQAANAHVLLAKSNGLKLAPMQRFEITIKFDENQTGIDLDNGVKGIIDYLCLINLIEDDGPSYMRRLVVEWGEAPTGCRVTVRACA